MNMEHTDGFHGHVFQTNTLSTMHLMHAARFYDFRLDLYWKKQNEMNMWNTNGFHGHFDQQSIVTNDAMHWMMLMLLDFYDF